MKCINILGMEDSRIQGINNDVFDSILFWKVEREGGELHIYALETTKRVLSGDLKFKPR
jgi:hypothetical protein